MRQGTFSISVFVGTISAMTYGAQQTAAKPSLNCLLTVPGTEATSNGSRSTQVAALVMDFSTNFGPSSSRESLAYSTVHSHAGCLGNVVSMTTRLTITSGTFLAHFQSHLTDVLMWCGMTRETPPTTFNRSCSIPGVPMAAQPGPLMSR